MNPKKQFEPSDEEKEIISSIRTHFGMDWTIIDRIGQGTNGKVYLAEKQQLLSSPERCAFKCIFVNPSQDNYNESFRKNLERETQTLKKLRGEPHIVQYEDSIILTRDDSHGYVIIIKMELMQKSIDEDKKYQWTDAEVIDLGIAICIALEKLEKHHIIHRDIKPANIFVSIDGEYKLGDFGEAKILSGTVHEMTVRGTYSYMSPEIAQRDPTADTRADIYSLGMVMYRLLNNNRGPFVNAHSTNVSYEELQEAQNRRFNKEDPTEPPCNCTNSLLANAILKACKGKPEERWQSPAEFRRTLESIKNPPPIHNAQAYQTINNGSMSSNPQFIHPKNNSINKALVFAVIVLSLTLMVMFGILLWMINNSRQSKTIEESSASQSTNSSITSELEYSSKLTEETDSSNDLSSSFPESMEEPDFSEATIVEETSVPTEKEISSSNGISPSSLESVEESDHSEATIVDETSVLTEEEIRNAEIQKLIEKAENYSDQEKYDEAIATLDTAEELYGSNSTITNKKMNINKKKSIFTINEYKNSNDYKDAIQFINTLSSDLSSDNEIIEQKNLCITKYRNMVLSESEEIFKTSGYTDAIDYLNEALKILIDDAIINDKISYYQQYAPVSIASLEYFTGNDFSVDHNIKDNLGNIHNNVTYPMYQAFGNAWNINVYKINKQYSKLTGLWFQYYKYRTSGGNGLPYKGTLEIYGDGVLLYAGNMGPGIEPIFLNINISGVNELTIDYFGGGNSGSYSGIANFAVQK